MQNRVSAIPNKIKDFDKIGKIVRGAGFGFTQCKPLHCYQLLGDSDQFLLAEGVTKMEVLLWCRKSDNMALSKHQISK